MRNEEVEVRPAYAKASAGKKVSEQGRKTAFFAAVLILPHIKRDIQARRLAAAWGVMVLSSSFIIPHHLSLPKLFPNSMTKSLRNPLLLLFALFSLSTARAQDQQFTQFYAAPLTLNPALTGAFEGKYRVGTVYRDQWRKVLDAPVRTFALAADLRFDAGKKKVKEDAVGIGLLFSNDKAGIVDFSTTQIAVSAAFHKSLGVNNKQYLSLGLQGGLTQRNVSYASLTFHDQFDGVTGYTFGTGENLPENNFSFTDLNLGLNYTAQMGRSARLYAGAAFHHAGKPRTAFFEDAIAGAKLYPRYSAQVAANLPLSRDGRISLLPRFLVASQGPHLQVNTGANFRMAMGQYGGTALHLGGWARPVRNSDGMALDALVALAGIEFNNVLIGLSYDLNLKALGANQRQGAFEISVAYLGNYDNEEILCPKF